MFNTSISDNFNLYGTMVWMVITYTVADDGSTDKAANPARSKLNREDDYFSLPVHA